MARIRFDITKFLERNGITLDEILVIAREASEAADAIEAPGKEKAKAAARAVAREFDRRIKYPGLVGRLVDQFDNFLWNFAASVIVEQAYRLRKAERVAGESAVLPKETVLDLLKAEKPFDKLNKGDLVSILDSVMDAASRPDEGEPSAE